MTTKSLRKMSTPALVGELLRLSVKKTHLSLKLKVMTRGRRK